MTNKEISSKALNIIMLNQRFQTKEIDSRYLLSDLDTIMNNMSLEDLLILGCALTFIADETEKTCKK